MAAKKVASGVKKSVKKSVKKITNVPTPTKIRTADPTYIPAGMEAYCVPTASIKFLPDNAHVSDVAKIQESIVAHGFRVPLIVDSKGTVICGNGRLRAAKNLGMKLIPVIRQDFLSPEARTAFAMIENRVHEYGTWDEKVLTKILDDVGKAKAAIPTGFSIDDMNAIKFRAVGKLIAGADISWIISKCLRGSLYVLKYAVVSGGKLSINALDAHAQIDTDLEDGTVLSLDMYRKAGAVYDAIVTDESLVKSVLADFPATPELSDVKPFSILSSDALFAEFVSDDSSRSPLCGICFDKGIQFATDGHTGVSIVGSRGADVGISIPADAWKTFRNASQVSYAKDTTGNTVAIAEGDGYRVVTKTESPVPSYEKVIPKATTVFKIDPKQIADAADALIPYTNEKTRAVIFLEGRLASLKTESPKSFAILCDNLVGKSYSAEKLVQVMRAAQKLSDGPCDAYVGAGDYSALTICCGKHTLLLMPLRLEESIESVEKRIGAAKVSPPTTSTLSTKHTRVLVKTKLGVFSVDVEHGFGASREDVRKRIAGTTATLEVD